jgi:H+/Cl- antiporter ClcA
MIEMKKLLPALLLSFITGALIAGVYQVFTVFVEEAQHFIWFDIADTETNKLAAIPVAIVGGLALAGALRFVHNKGHQEIGHTIASLLETKNIQTVWVARSLAIGAISLVAGASLGPEAILLPVSYGIGYILAKRLGMDQPQTIGLIAVVALLAAFFNSPAAGLLPIGFALAAKRKDAKTFVIVLLLSSVSALASIGLLRVLDQRDGFVTLSPIGDLVMSPLLFVVAMLLAAVATLLPFLLTSVIPKIEKIFDTLPNIWWLQGAIAGLGIGILYFLLGPIGFFSGHEGLNELLQNNSEYTSLQLAGLAIGKLLLTAWSVATIYRGGIVFPQLLIAMSLALLFTGAIPDSSWLLTLLVSTFFGVFVGSLGSLFIAASFVFSLFGIAVWPLMLAAAIGSYAIKYVLKKHFAGSAAV